MCEEKEDKAYRYPVFFQIQVQVMLESIDNVTLQYTEYGSAFKIFITLTEKEIFNVKSKV